MLDTSTICEELSINKTTLDYWRNNNKVSSIKKGKKFYYDIDEIKEFITNKNKKKEIKGIFCKKCNQITKYKSWKSFVRNHLIPEHNITSKEYYDEFLIKNEEEKYCQRCGKEKAFLSISKGYKEYCSGTKCRGNEPDILKKIEKSKLEKYGDKFYTNKEKARETSLKKYGTPHYTNREKYRETVLSRYGDFDLSKIPEFAVKRKQTCLDRYGVEHYTNGKKISESKNRRYFDKITKYLESNDKCLLDYKNGIIKIKCNKCGEVSELSTKLACSRVIADIDLCLFCNPLGVCSSYSENEIKQFLDDNNIRYKENDRLVLGGKEIDIYCKEQSIGIEFNGCFWHSSLFKDYKYHTNKLNHCETKGVRLIQIFEDQWKHKNEIIKSMLLNLFNKTPNKIYARKCKFGFVSEENKDLFLTKNHLQGECRSKINYGLFYEGELVSLMCFERSRYKKYDWELVRFCNKINATVVGAASKLFKLFITNNDVDNIVSYCDRLWSVGNMYDKIGFELSHISKPSYFYVSKSELIRYHRFYFNKQKLNIPDDLTEEEHLSKMGYLKIYNCGYKVFVWNRRDLCQ